MLNRFDHKISDFLTASCYRPWRHLLLQFVVVLITMNVFWDEPDVILAGRMGVWSVYFLMMDGMVYFNIYVLVPRLLLKSKTHLYILSVSVLTIAGACCIGALYSLLLPVGESHGETDFAELFGGIASSTISLGLFIAGISTLLFFKYRIEQSRRIDDLKSATLQSELKYLKSQINPHFLFNMLNNANIMVHEDAAIASHILAKLNDLLRYQINGGAVDSVHLDADIAFLNDFLELEKTRRDAFDCTISITGDTATVQAPPLLFIPFVENAVKHSSDSERPSYVHVEFDVREGRLSFVCKNSKPANPVRKADGGLGLKNIRRRLDLLFGEDYSLELQDEETSYTVNLQFKV
jgi:hypothetical protein